MQLPEVSIASIRRINSETCSPDPLRAVTKDELLAIANGISYDKASAPQRYILNKPGTASGEFLTQEEFNTALSTIRDALSQLGSDLAVFAPKNRQRPNVPNDVCKGLNRLVASQYPDHASYSKLRNDPAIKALRHEISFPISVRFQLGSSAVFDEFIAYVRRQNGNINLNEFRSAEPDDSKRRERARFVHLFRTLINSFGFSTEHEADAEKIILEFLKKQAGVEKVRFV